MCICKAGWGLCGLMALAVAGGVAGMAQQPAAKPARATEAKPAAKMSISSVAFMAGAWRGEDDRGIFEEHWSEAAGESNVMGMFRWLKPDGHAVMFEMLSITQEGGDVFLRMVHFSPKLAAREEKGDPMTLRLAEAGSRKVVFRAAEGEKRLAGVTYDGSGDGELKITVEFPSPEREPLKFALKRMAAGK